MRIDAKIEYYEPYLPTKRHRIPRYRKVVEDILIELPKIKKTDAVLAFIVEDYCSYLDENGKNKYGIVPFEYYAYQDKLYERKKDMRGALDKGNFEIERLVDTISDYGVHRIWCSNEKDHTREYVLKYLCEFVGRFLIIDGNVYERVGEPRYVVMTFGLGHNHGGSAISIHGHYNENISKDRYFNALQRNEAFACLDEIAARRGDTESVGKGRELNIHVMMPKLVHCNPQEEHGKGNSLINDMESLIQGSNSSMEAGILVVASMGKIKK